VQLAFARQDVKECVERHDENQVSHWKAAQSQLIALDEVLFITK